MTPIITDRALTFHINSGPNGTVRDRSARATLASIIR